MARDPINDALIRELLAAERQEKALGYSDPFNLASLTQNRSDLPEPDLLYDSLKVAFKATIATSLRSEFAGRSEQLREATKPCESKIEVAFLLGLVCACALHDMSVVVTDTDSEENVYLAKGGGWGDMALHITPQEQIDEYRVDFALGLVLGDFGDDATRLGSTTPSNISELAEMRLVIECDGHDFHERTKEQAARDKQRDRALFCLGYPVMRFTGSEIVAGPVKCAESVMKWIFESNN